MTGVEQELEEMHMGKLIVHQDKITSAQIMEDVIKVCPFNALENIDGKLEINAGCKLCKLCVKKGPAGVMEFIEEDEAFLVRRFQEFPDGAHIGGKSRKRAVERLLISDCAAHIAEHRQPRFLPCEYRPAGLV